MTGPQSDSWRTRRQRARKAWQEQKNGWHDFWSTAYRTARTQWHAFKREAHARFWAVVLGLLGAAVGIGLAWYHRNWTGAFLGFSAILLTFNHLLPAGSAPLRWCVLVLLLDLPIGAWLLSLEQGFDWATALTTLIFQALAAAVPAYIRGRPTPPEQQAMNSEP